MEKYFNILRKCSLFNNIGDESLIKMLTCFNAEIKFFDKKCTVFAEGDPAKYIGIVLTGQVQMIRMDYYGNRSILSEMSASEIFGEAFACAEVDRLPVSVIAGEPCETMLIECSRIMNPCPNSCGFHNRLIFNLMKELTKKTLIIHQKIEVISKRTTRERLMTYLTIQSKNTHSNSFDIPFDRQELADYLEVERSGLSAEISKLRRDGILKSRKNHFELCNL